MHRGGKGSGDRHELRPGCHEPLPQEDGLVPFDDARVRVAVLERFEPGVRAGGRRGGDHVPPLDVDRRDARPGDDRPCVGERSLDARALEGPCECAPSVPAMGRLLESTMLDERHEPASNGVEQGRRTCEAGAQIIDDGCVLGIRRLVVMGTHRNTELGVLATGTRTCTAPDPRCIPQRMDDRLGLASGAQRSEIGDAARRRPCDGESRVTLTRERHPMEGSWFLGSSVVAWRLRCDQAEFDDGRLDLARGGEVVDPMQVPQHCVDRAAMVASEIRPHPSPQVGRLADVDGGIGAIPEDVHAGATRQVLGEGELPDRPCTLDGRERQEVVEMGHTDRASSLEEGPEHVRGGLRIVEGAVVR